jgi:hypothetical protein
MARVLREREPKTATQQRIMIRRASSPEIPTAATMIGVAADRVATAAEPTPATVAVVGIVHRRLTDS